MWESEHRPFRVEVRERLERFAAHGDERPRRRDRSEFAPQAPKRAIIGEMRSQVTFARAATDFAGAHRVALVVWSAAVATFIRTYLAWRYYGFQTGDDLEVLEEAFRRSVGLRHAPWDIRSLFLPDIVIAPVIGATHALGASRAFTLALVARFVFVTLTTLNIFLVWCLGRVWYGEAEAAVAAILYSFHWMPLVYGSSCEPRTIAVTLILTAVLCIARGPDWRFVVVAGSLCAVATTARYSESIFFCGAALLAYCSADGAEGRRRNVCWSLTAGFAVVFSLVVGWYDFLTWGQWFGSLVKFANLTFVRRESSSIVAAQPVWWYVTNMFHWLPASAVPLLFAGIRKRADKCRAGALIGTPLVLLSVIFHKELRYVQVVVPFALLLAAHGAVLWWETRRTLVIILVAASLPLGLGHIGLAERRTTNAASAAEYIASHRPTWIALSQAWAYGGRVFLGNEPRIDEIGVPPDASAVANIARSISVIGVYSTDVNQRLREICQKAGLSREMKVDHRGGRSVTVFSRY